MQRSFKVFLSICLIWLGVCLWGLQASARTVAIALDPGHGGEEEGAMYYGLLEKDLNLKMAKFLKEELSRYPEAEVMLTREEDEQVPLYERARRASEGGADILISLHFNASVSHQSKGASVYITTAEAYRENLRHFADYLLGEFEAVGLDNAGTFARVTQMGGRRGDGSFDDYYGVIRHAVNYGMPAMIIEHCYMDAEADKPFFASEEGLRKLAKADANGIAAYYGLQAADGTAVTPKTAKKYGATTKALENGYYEAPEITGLRLLQYDGMTMGKARFQVSVEDGVGVTSIYLVYKHRETGASAEFSLILPESLTTGTYELEAYIPPYLELGKYDLSYIGAYNASGYDAGYNYAGGSMVGFGKCDWLNSFSYGQEADLTVTKKGTLADLHLDKIIRRLAADMESGLGRGQSLNLAPAGRK